MTSKVSSFSAADAALGYLYQVRVALLWSLQRLKKSQSFLVSLETLDDVTFEANGEADVLLQTKHHKNREARLTDASPDLWKTLRVWFEGYANGDIPSGASLHLLTTATAPEGTVAAYLRPRNRDVGAALKSLEATARSSASTDNAAAYKAFLDSPSSTRQMLLDSVFVIDAAPSVSDLGEELRTEVYWAAESQYHDAFVERLEGWWLRRSLKQLVDITKGDRIISDEIEAQMSDLREQFKTDSLPIDEDLLTFSLDEATYEAHTDSVFVRQIELVKAGKKRIVAAVRDYYRAFEQRSRWLRDDLLLIGDIEKYERRLVEEWELIFEGMKDELGEGAAETAREKAAREVLTWAERVTIPIRPAVVEPFVTRGSLHMLADKLRVGWHPEFKDRLEHLLTKATGAVS
jgi:hypothetical protein